MKFSNGYLVLFLFAISTYSASSNVPDSIDSMDSEPSMMLRSSGHKQDRDFLDSVYKAMKKANGNLEKNEKLQAWAQDPTLDCKMEDHAQHAKNDGKVLKEYMRRGATLFSCSGSGCYKGKAFKEDPVRAAWKDSADHWKIITDKKNTRVGCAANRCPGSSGIYLWCYFA